MLVAISGGVTCGLYSKTNFGCTASCCELGVYVTEGKGYQYSIAPKDTTGHYTMTGYNENSPFIEFSLDDYCFETGTEYNLWYNEDMEDDSEWNNGGTAYPDIYICPATGDLLIS